MKRRFNLNFSGKNRSPNIERKNRGGINKQGKADAPPSKDGKRFMVLMSADSPEPRETQNHVVLVTNFFDEVRRRVVVQGE